MVLFVVHWHPGHSTHRSHRRHVGGHTHVRRHAVLLARGCGGSSVAAGAGGDGGGGGEGGGGALGCE